MPAFEQVEIGNFAMMVTLIMNDIAFNHQCVSSKEEACEQVVILMIANDDFEEPLPACEQVGILMIILMATLMTLFMMILVKILMAAVMATLMAALMMILTTLTREALTKQNHVRREEMMVVKCRSFK